MCYFIKKKWVTIHSSVKKSDIPDAWCVYSTSDFF